MMHFASPYDNIGMQCTNMEIRAETDSRGELEALATHTPVQKGQPYYTGKYRYIYSFIMVVFETKF